MGVTTLFNVLCVVLLTYMFSGLLFWFVYASLIILFIAVGIFINAIFITGGNDMPPYVSPKDSSSALEEQEMRSDFQKQSQPVITTPNLDRAIQKLMDLIIRDFVLSWYSHVGHDTEIFSNSVQKEFQVVLKNISRRISRVDKATFLSIKCVNVISEHLEKIQRTNESCEGKLDQSFGLHSCLEDDDAELQHIRLVAESFVVFLAPRAYRKLLTVRFLFREILACKVFKPAIDLITDPHYLNSTLYNWLLYREQLQHNQSCVHTASHDQLMSTVKSCVDLEILKQIRLNIISEIMLSTTLKNIKQSRGIDADKRFSPGSKERGELLYSRDLLKYISQLKIAKAMCERQIHRQGGAEYLSYVEESQQQENVPGRTILSFQLIMQSEEARIRFAEFLRKTDKDCVVRYWEAIEGMKKATQSDQYRIANQITEAFLSQKSSLLLQIISNAVVVAMKAYMNGDEGPEGFWESQLVVYRFMEEKFYGSFLASDLYHRHVSELSDVLISSDILDSVLPSTDEQKPEALETDEKSRNSDIILHSTYAEEKLELLDNRIRNKRDALQAAREFHKSSPQAEKKLEGMSAELDAMFAERKHLEYHIEQTSLWMHHIGEWKAYICDADVIQEGNKEVAIFVIVVNLVGIAKRATFEELSSSGSTDAWIITRKLEDFEELQRELIQILSSIRRFKIPSRVNPNSAASLQKAREDLQLFLSTVLADELLSQSEPVFVFLNKSLEFVKHSASGKELNSRNVFSTSEILKKVALSIDRLAGSKSKDESDRDVLLDVALQPLYNLIANVFELAGMSNWLRRSLVGIVQVTYGKSINRKVQETIEWFVSEPMLTYYLDLFREAYWPNGQLACHTELPSNEEKQRMRRMAKQKLLKSIPAAVRNLFGEVNTRHGAARVFDAFQNSQFNKHIFYIILDMFMREVFGQ